MPEPQRCSPITIRRRPPTRGSPHTFSPSVHLPPHIILPTSSPSPRPLPRCRPGDRAQYEEVMAEAFELEDIVKCRWGGGGGLVGSDRDGAEFGAGCEDLGLK